MSFIFLKFFTLFIFKNSFSPLRNISSLPSSLEKNYFLDVTNSANSNLLRISTSSIAVGDYDNDAFPDFIAGKHIFKNISRESNIYFVEVTAQLLDEEIKGNSIWIDFDNDGLLDFITTSGQVFRQEKNKFIEISKRINFSLPANVHTLSFGDLNEDGFADLVVGMNEIHTDNTFSFVSPHAYLNIEGKYFLEISSQLNLDKFPAYTRGILWADFNNDQAPDLYFSNYRLHANYLLQVKNKTLVDSTKKYDLAGIYNPKKNYDTNMKKFYGPLFGHTIGAAWGDLNNDGNLDLWSSNLVHKFVGHNNGVYDIRGYVCDDSKIYINTGAPFYNLIDARKETGLLLKPIGDWNLYKGDELWAHTTMADFDNDGLLDVYVSQVYNLDYAYSLLFKNNGNLKFKNISFNEPLKIYDSYAGAWADFNNDGKMDFINSGRGLINAPPQIRIFKNIFQSKNHFLKIKLNGSKSGKNPVTTKVKLFTSKGIFIRQYDGVTGTMNQQNDPTLHFGLGDIDKIIRMEVYWNSKKIQSIKNIEIDKTYIINEGDI